MISWRYATLTTVAATALLSGCVGQRLDKMQRDQREVRALVADQNVAIEGLRRRVEIIKQELSEQGGKGAKATPQQLQRLNELDARITALEQNRAIGGSPSGRDDGAPLGGEAVAARPVDVVPTPAAARPLSPLDAAISRDEAAMAGQRPDPDYREALNLVRQGQCSQAAPRLRDFIRKNPKSDLADNAQYWIGACYYSQREYNQAIKELSDVMLRYSKGDKAPAALLMLADAFNDSGDQIDAKLVLKKLMSEHPRSEEAERAKQKLQSLGD